MNEPDRYGDHDTFDELAVGWALHALEPEDETLFARHLPDCPRCSRTVAEAFQLMAALATDLPPAEPSGELRGRLSRAVEETEQLPGNASGEEARDPAPELPAAPVPTRGRTAFRPPPTPVAASPGSGIGSRWPGLPRALVAAAVAAILGLGVWDVVLSTSRDQTRAVAAQQEQMLKSLLTPGQATLAPVSNRDGRAVATVVARQGQVQVVTWGLSTNDQRASTYVVWGMRQGAPVALGTFDVVRSQMDLRTIGSAATGLDHFSAYGISLERGRQAPPAPTDIVATGQVSS
jgi:hypothetical protein